ncbi:NnrS family protein [Shewanella sp. Scap07]|uniref:NnrS family protein n=1 Tax=Shewanella sp. Scap07 TaxID=2589987 RepID=UPI0015C071CF|nr:NnrS family protein [Shewanella sp. Scap07]QLE84305.1 NnrS family protein [Shewanella sp. Scap07]
MAKQPIKLNSKTILNSDGQLSQISPQRTVGLTDTIAKHPLWELAFRPWFIAASLLSCISMLAWWLALTGNDIMLSNSSLSPVVWHIHEMLFGFGATIAVGFLLTAAQTWTGKQSIHGWGLIALTLIWLVARGLIWFATDGLQWLTVGMQSLWWLISITYLAMMVVTAKSQRNYQFIPLLSMMMLLNIGVLLSDFANNTALALHLSRSAILVFGLLVGIVAGRVIPFFTGRGAQHAKVAATPMLDKLLLISTVIGASVFLLGYFVPLPFTPASLLILSGTLHLMRQYFWAPLATAKVPLLWSLHASYFALAIGLIGLGLSYHVETIRFADALHMITVGTIGAMILAMISRVSLGHTGRALSVHRNMIAAFALLLIGAVVRVALPSVGQPILGWQLSAGCWIIAFGLFLWHYIPILTAARASK